MLAYTGTYVEVADADDAKRLTGVIGQFVEFQAVGYIVARDIFVCASSMESSGGQ